MAIFAISSAKFSFFFFKTFAHDEFLELNDFASGACFSRNVVEMLLNGNRIVFYEILIDKANVLVELVYLAYEHLFDDSFGLACVLGIV